MVSPHQEAFQYLIKRQRTDFDRLNDSFQHLSRMAPLKRYARVSALAAIPVGSSWVGEEPGAERPAPVLV